MSSMRFLLRALCQSTLVFCREWRHLYKYLASCAAFVPDPARPESTAEPQARAPLRRELHPEAAELELHAWAQMCYERGPTIQWQRSTLCHSQRGPRPVRRARGVAEYAIAND